jgi:acetylornithine deacetylase
MSGTEQTGVSVSDLDLAAAVAAEADAMEDLLCRLVETPTTLGNEEPGQQIMEEAFAGLGLEPVDVMMDADILREHPLAAPFSWSVDWKRNVVATWPGAGGGGRSLVLNGHIDVVPAAAESLWTQSPYSAVRDGDWIVGAVCALRRLGLEPLADLQLQSVVEEECGGNGALQCVLAGFRPDGVVITEPFPGAVTVSQVGVLWFHVDIAGIPGHVGESGVGVNAIEAAFPVIASLRELEAELNESPPPPYDDFPHPINLNVGVIEGGDWPSTVAAECSLSCRLALYPGQQVDELKARVEAAVGRAAAAHPYLARHPPRVRYDGFAGQGVEVPPDAPLVEAMAAAHERVAGEPVARIATTATTDARVFVASGIPAVCYGPLAEHIHGIDERVFFPSVVSSAQVLAVFIRDWCKMTA